MALNSTSTTPDIRSKIEEGKAFILTTGDLGGTAGTEVPRVLFTNPINSGKLLKIFRIEEGTYTSTGNSIFRYYLSPTVTNTTTILNPTALLLNSGKTSSVLAYLNPTVSDNGTKIHNPIAGQMTINSRQMEYLWIIPPGTSILINVRTNAGTTTWGISIYWVEE